MGTGSAARRYKGSNGPRFGKAPVLEMADATPVAEPESAPWEAEIEEDEPEAESEDYAHGRKSQNGSDEEVFRNYTRQAKSGSAEYVYRNPARGLHQKAIRKDGKKGFPQEHWDGTQWVDGAPAIIYPYRLPELLAAGTDAKVHLFEGEKDADSGAAWGLVSTTNPCGAGQWTPALSQWLIAPGFKKVVVHIDNDKAGRKRKDMIAAQLGGKIEDLRFIEYTELKEHGDFTNWQEAGGTPEKLRERIAATEKFGDCLDIINAGDDTGMPLPRAWLLGNVFCRQFVSSLLGDGGVGKTAVRYAHYLSVATKAQSCRSTPVGARSRLIDIPRRQRRRIAPTHEGRANAPRH
jgi:hypothetical protein